MIYLNKMDYKTALNILEINISELDNYDILYKINLKYLKKKYHKMALKYHPDKNDNISEYNHKFQKINEAYHYLLQYCNECDFKEDNYFEDNLNYNYEYVDILQIFIKGILQGKYSEIISTIIKEIVLGCKKITVKLFEDLDKNTCLNIYSFLSKYHSILHLNENILDEIKNIVLKKYDNVLLYKLNPSINDILNNNLYKLYVENKLYLVPLWYNEVYFDGSNCEILVMCDPELPQNIIIDDDNNIYIDKQIFYTELQNLITNNANISVNIGETEFNIPISELYMKIEQYYKIKNKGLTKIKNDDIYDISDKADIIVKLTII